MSEPALLLAELCTLTDRPFIEDVENHFAGYFDELTITVKLRSEASDADVISLQNDMLAFFGEKSDARPGLTWRVNFSRDGKPLRSLYPGDAPRTSSQDLEWTG